MKNNKIRLVSCLFISAALLLGFTNCGQPVNFESVNPLDKVRFQDIIVGNPLTSKSLVANICSVITSCHPELSEASCEAGVLNTTGIESQLGLPKGSMSKFSDVVRAESDGQIRTDLYAANACVSELKQLKCNDVLVQKAYDPAASDPFAGVAFMMPTSFNSCPAVFNLPARTEYFVATTGSDLNDGSIEKPWATINHAANSLILGKDGVTVHVASGTYSPPTTPNCAKNSGYSCGILTTKSGTASAPITFISDELGGAKIAPSDASTAWYNSGDYVNIVGFEIVGNSNTNMGIQNDGSNVRVESNRVHDIAVPIGCAMGVAGGGIAHTNPSAHDNDTVKNVVHDIGPFPGNGQSATSYCNHSHGINYYHPQANIQNNVIFRVGAWGIHSWNNASRLNISNNLLFNNGARTVDGNLVGGAIVIAAPAGSLHDYSTASNNVIRNNSGVGINNRMNAGTHNLYANNVFYSNGSNFNFSAGTVDIGSIMADPKMINFTMDGKGDYRLQASSPAINAGTSSCAQGTGCTPEKDYAGFLRPYGAALDIGPFEWHP